MQRPSLSCAAPQAERADCRTSGDTPPEARGREIFARAAQIFARGAQIFSRAKFLFSLCDHRPVVTTGRQPGRPLILIPWKIIAFARDKHHVICHDQSVMSNTTQTDAISTPVTHPDPKISSPDPEIVAALDDLLVSLAAGAPTGSHEVRCHKAVSDARDRMAAEAQRSACLTPNDLPELNPTISNLRLGIAHCKARLLLGLQVLNEVSGESDDFDCELAALEGHIHSVELTARFGF